MPVELHVNSHDFKKKKKKCFDKERPLHAFLPDVSNQRYLGTKHKRRNRHMIPSSHSLSLPSRSK